MLDLGASCEAAAWPCAATENRAALIVLDGMGYHAANVDGLLTSTVRDALRHHLQMGLVDAESVWRLDGPPFHDADIAVSAAPYPALRLEIRLTPADTSRLHAQTLFLAGLQRAQVGVVSLQLEPLEIVRAHVATLPAATRPDPVIAGTVDFVLDEARFYQRRKRP